MLKATGSLVSCPKGFSNSLATSFKHQMLSKSMKDKRGPATGFLVKVITYMGISSEKATKRRPSNCAKGSGKGTSAIFKQLLKPSLDGLRTVGKRGEVCEKYL